MAKHSMKLEEFIAKYPFWGEWKVSYTDGTHLRNDEYVKLGYFNVHGSEKNALEYPVLPFCFKPVDGQQIECCFTTVIERHLSDPSKEEEKKRLKQEADKAKEVILDQLVESMVRTGLLRPELCLIEKQTIEMNFLKVMQMISKGGYLTLITDTGALRKSAISFLCKFLPKIPIWTVVPVFVMTEVQRQVNELSSTWIKSRYNPVLKNYKMLRKRPQVSIISRELNHIRQYNCPMEILTTLPEHLGQSNGKSNIDRLIIESTKNLKRDRGIHQGVYLLTGDKDMASLASLEGQDSLHVGVPSLPTEVSSVRYNSYNGRLILTPLHFFLWDLAQIFSTIRLENERDSRKYDLVYYSQARKGFFAYDVMEIREES